MNNKLNLTPIILFVYNRPWHTEQTVEALKKNELAGESDLFIFSDGPKTANDENMKKVREYIKTIDGFKSITIIEREKNLGLANSVVEGVTEIVNKFGKVIVLEDDLVTSRHFLRFMNDALNIYEQEEKVVSIHGYSYPVKSKLPETFFLKGADCWGWATWKRGWDIFNSDGSELLTQIYKRNLQKEFDFNGSYPFTDMLKSQMEGEIDSWAIRWYASAFLKNKLTLYPGKSLVKNIGMDGSGIHCKKDLKFLVKSHDVCIDVNKIDYVENINAKKKISKFFKKKEDCWMLRMLKAWVCFFQKKL
jgi:hypothetical protein